MLLGFFDEDHFQVCVKNLSGKALPFFFFFFFCVCFTLSDQHWLLLVVRPRRGGADWSAGRVEEGLGGAVLEERLQEHPHRAGDADEDEDPEEEAVDHHGDVLPVLAHLGERGRERSLSEQRNIAPMISCIAPATVVNGEKGQSLVWLPREMLLPTAAVC